WGRDTAECGAAFGVEVRSLVTLGVSVKRLARPTRLDRADSARRAGRDSAREDPTEAEVAARGPRVSQNKLQPSSTETARSSSTATGTSARTMTCAAKSGRSSGASLLVSRTPTSGANAKPVLSATIPKPKNG